MPETPILDALESETLTATEWARRLKVVPSTVTRWAMAGRVEYIQVGREIRITAEAMERCLRERTEERRRRHRHRTAGDAASAAADRAEIDQELAEI